MSEPYPPAPVDGDPMVVTESGAAAAQGGFGRRRFIRWLLGFSVISSLAIIVTPIVGFLIPSRTSTAAAGGRVLAGTTDALPVGSGAVVAVGSKPAVVVNTAAGIKAFSAICTHLGCIVAFDATANMIICPCHDGRFNPATGAVVSGPPPTPLAPLTTVVEGSDIYIVTG